MKRVVRRRSGREIYGPKWQSSSSENKDDDDALLSASTEATEIAQTTAAPLAVTETNGQSPAGINRRRIRPSDSHETMYRATLEGDYMAVEVLLQRHPNLATDEISEEGDRALHIAAAIKHQEIVRKLVEKMSPEDLELLDGNGYTACCYAALSGVVDIADLMKSKNPTLATARDRENKTPLYKAAFRGNAKMVSYFLESAEVEDLPMEEWFDLLLMTIRRKMFGKQRNNGVMRQDMRLLAKKLWDVIQRSGHASVVELMKNPPILHDAAEVGSVELITMLTHTYPDLVWHANTEGYTIFHIAVKYRKGNLFVLIDEIGARKDLIAVSQDENGNNILHFAAELGPQDFPIAKGDDVVYDSAGNGAAIVFGDEK